MVSLREFVTFEQAMVVAAGLWSDAETDSVAQYDRGMCELIADLWPKEGVFHADRRDEIAEMLSLIASIEEARWRRARSGRVWSSGRSPSSSWACSSSPAGPSSDGRIDDPR